MKFEDVVKVFFELDTTNVDDILDYFSSKFNLDREALEVGYYIGRICAIVSNVIPFKGRNYLDLTSFSKEIELIKKKLRELNR